MKNSAISPKDLIEFFEKTTGKKFVDINTGEPVLKLLAENESSGTSDYDKWLEQQDEEVKAEHRMGEL